MAYYIVDVDKIVAEFADESDLIEKAEEWCIQDWTDVCPETRLIPSIRYNFEEAVEYLTENCGYRVIKGEEL